MQRIVIGIGGASGAIYSKRLLDRLVALSDQAEEVAVVITSNGRINWELEIGTFEAANYPFQFYEEQDYHAPFASGSAKFETMIICPCSMGMIGRIATGVSTNLISRAADVILKERRRLILVPREAPLNLIHLNNMKTITEAGGIVCPASPSFYHRPQTIMELIDTVIDRVLDLAGFQISTQRWGN
ncbi:MAG: UbiX family flavin prenyltransferase [Saprospiraceae bacterium]|nr:UbiX family flavin prenyltransferase [Saprospiraceae bacterium]